MSVFTTAGVRESLQKLTNHTFNIALCDIDTVDGYDLVPDHQAYRLGRASHVQPRYEYARVLREGETFTKQVI